MRVPISWLKDYVDITLSIEELAHRMTLAGLEIEGIEYIGIPAGDVKDAGQHLAVPISTDHLVWDREKIVVGHILEVKAHPNADRLVLAMVDSGIGEVETVVTGAPNLYPYKDQGPIAPPLVVPYAREGAEVIDGHKDDGSRMILKARALRGIENKSMVCSEKELGISNEHEGIMVIDADEPPGTPLQDVLGDAILDIAITPNMARCQSIIGVAREVAALTGQKVRYPSLDVVATGEPIEKQVSMDIREPDLNPRFTLALIKGIEIKPSPEWMQRRLKYAGMRPINNIVDVTNYVMLEFGEPLHAFDYDILAERSGGKAPTIITRLPEKGEKLTTLEGVERELDPFTILVCDTAGALSLGGIMGGLESEIYDASTYMLDAQGVELGEEEKAKRGKADARPQSSTNVLLEAANWNFINVRKTLQAQRERGKEISSEAGARFSRGAHPEQAMVGLLRGIEMMRQVAGGEIAKGVVDAYPNPAPVVTVDLPVDEVERLLGVSLSAGQITEILTGLEFGVEDKGQGLLHVTVPNHRLDIGLLPNSEHQDIAELVARADLIEEIARIYGYDRAPETMITDVIPPQHANPSLSGEEKVRDLMVRAGLQDIVTYRLTTPEHEALLTPPGEGSDWPDMSYITLANPISVDRTVMRHTLTASVLDVVAANARWRARQALFEIGRVYLPVAGQKLPDEPTHLCIALTGERTLPAWQKGSDAAAQHKASEQMDYYDLKGVVESLIDGLHIEGAHFEPAEHSSFYPGRAAHLVIGGTIAGTLGELHPLVRKAFELPEQPVLIAELDLGVLIGVAGDRHVVEAISTYPAIYQDIAVVMNEDVPAADIEAAIREAGGWMLVTARLFDVYRGEQIGVGKKSLAYALTFQAPDRTLKDKDADKQRNKIVRTLEAKFGAKLRA
ncbi:MAG: phenylalanine--tRNA ligase subunit beta [Anaerolineae bacterium]|nr:phenylalanine--tRNA ligase subunit beta [Anaerolineae bacterium]